MKRTLKGLRADKHLSQAEVADAVGIAYSAYSSIEKALDSRETLEKIGKLLGAKIAVTIEQ